MVLHAELGVPFCTQIVITLADASGVGRPIYLDQAPIFRICGYWGHMPLLTDEAIAVATKHPNVFIDIYTADSQATAGRVHAASRQSESTVR